MLIDTLVEEIRTHGSLSVAEFMARALFDVEEGYYTTQHVFGRKGDFVTSPEICQIFGEMVAVFIASTMAAWREQQPDKKIQLVEMGPGRGTLMHDMLRTMQYMPDTARPNAVHMIEASPHLADQQQHLLAPFLQKNGDDFIVWQMQLAELLPMPSMIIANEFFDALPIQQFQYKDGEWFERMIGEEDGQLAWKLRLANKTLVDWYPMISKLNLADGAILEYSDAAAKVMKQISECLVIHGGMAVIIDYGYTEHAFGDSLQAVKKHSYADVLKDVGEVDLTAHVNFAMLKEIAESHGLKVVTLTTQGHFLKTLGAEIRLSNLCQKAEPAQVIDLISGLERLIAPDKMGNLFKVLVVTSADIPVVEAFS